MMKTCPPSGRPRPVHPKLDEEQPAAKEDTSATTRGLWQGGGDQWQPGRGQGRDRESNEGVRDAQVENGAGRKEETTGGRGEKSGEGCTTCREVRMAERVVQLVER